jgi:thiaminase (transcriptional activator TenA)
VTERFTEELHRLAAPVWEAQHEHSFIRGIGDGTLSLERFRHWVRQDYLYLIEYARLLALAAARAPDLEGMTRFADLARETLRTEMEMHRSYARGFGISPEEMERETKAPTCQAYTDFLLRTAALGDYAELVAALLPCMWGFCEIGQRLAERGAPDDPRYAEWIAMYASPEFANLAAWCRDVVDRVAEGLPGEALERMERAFLTSSRYEHLFWEMAWRLEEWPV